jgi:hypothetical protein
MFLADAEAERNTLRQGDILRAVHLVGALHLQGIHLINDQANKSVMWTVPKAPEFGDVAVLSHSCEIDLLNNVKLTSIILAPVRDLHSATDPGKRQELIDSNIIAPGTAGSYLKYFYLAPHERLEHEAGGVIDFSKCFSVRKNSYDYLLQRKILQMQPEIAKAMALKLALYFHRAQEPKAAAAA